ncbi:AAA family ATPase [Actinoplanes sp. NPDC026619]|uniref:ATP-binding protein n=1 Tax=Actinoplanes sp. NPDC026619 TaxID=3155798 RepID=UPI0033EA29BB
MAGVLLQRDAEMAVLDHRLGSLRAGTGRLILVEGPAGIGKSSLITAASRAAAATGVRVLRAWGGPLEHDAGWGIARQLFAPLRDSAEWNELAVGAAALARHALDADGTEPAAGGEAMHAAVHGLVWLACGLAERGPTLLVIDDAHWADAPSLRWLLHLARQIAEHRLGILCVVRSGEPASAPGMLADLLAASPEPPIRPAPLGPAAVAAVLDQRLPGAAPGFASSCHAATGGNPFLLGALLDHLRAEGVDPTAAVAARLSSFGPEQVARTIERQLSRLPAGAGELARAFAVLGRDAPLRQAAELAGLPLSAAARLADCLRSAGLLGARELTHPLVAGALYQGLPAGERSLWHGRAAAILARERADPEAVALHLLRSEPARDAGTVATLRAAAERAGRRGAPESAAAFLRRALAEPPPDRADEADVHCRLGLVAAAQADPGSPTLLDAAVEQAADAGQRARIALAAGRALGLAGYFDDAVRLCRQGLDQPTDRTPAGGAEPGVLSRLEAELVANVCMRAAGVPEAHERLRRALPSELAVWRVCRAWEALCDGRDADEPRALLATPLPVEDGDSILGTFATFSLVVYGEFEAARDRCTDLIELARPRGWRIALAHGSFLRALALIQSGQIRDAAADARLAYDFKRINSPPPALVWSIMPLVEALTELDEPAEADEVLRTLGDLPEGAITTGLMLERRARLRLAQHRPADAHADLTAAAATWKQLDLRHPGMAAWRVDDCRALTALGEPEAARQLAEEHLALADRLGLPGPRAAGLRALAATGDPIEPLVKAAALTEKSPYLLEHTRVLVDLGAALRRANHRAAAREPLGRALSLADRGGMRLLARRCREELRAAGARPRRAPDSLTAAEHRVAELAARGLSNREIAQQLYVTRRTVETHLTHVFQKLGGTRADLRNLVV